MLEDEDLVSIEDGSRQSRKTLRSLLRYRLYNQEQIDSIVERMAAAATSNGPCRQFRRLATEENPNIQMILPLGGSWRCDETYIRVKGRWTYLYRAVDKGGRTIDFYLRRRETSPPRNTSSERP
jgi:transposase-like protein